MPDGFAHGFQTLRDASEVHYMLSTRYVPEAASGFRWDDPAFALSWPLPITVISDRDRMLAVARWKNERMKLLVFGAYGQAGSSLRSLAEGRGFVIDAPRRAVLDVRNTQDVAQYIEAARADWVVNFSAFHVLEACEDDFAEAMLVNAVAVQAMAAASRAAGAKFLSVSTDYVFDGRKAEPWREDDKARPLQAYGVSKRAGELAALAAAPERTFIVRTCGLYSHAAAAIAAATSSRSGWPRLATATR